MTGTGRQHRLRTLDRLLDREPARAFLPTLSGVVGGLWIGLIPDAIVAPDPGVTAAPSTWKPPQHWLAACILPLLLLIGARLRQWIHQRAVKTRGGVLLAVDEQGKEDTAKDAVLADAGTDYLRVIEVPGPKALDESWHWTTDDSHGPHWDTALDQLVYGVRALQRSVTTGPSPALVTWADWPVTLGLGQRLNGDYGGRHQPQRIVPRPCAGRGRTPSPAPSLSPPQAIVPADGYSLTERLRRREYHWPTDLNLRPAHHDPGPDDPGAVPGTGDTPTLLLVRATGQTWGPLPCQPANPTSQPKPLTLRDATGLGLTYTGGQDVHEARWHLPDQPDNAVHVEPRDTVNLAQDIARWIDEHVRRAPGDVLLGLLAPPHVAFAVGALWSQSLRDQPVTGHRVLPIVYDRRQGDLAVIGLDLARTRPRTVLASPGIGNTDTGNESSIGEAQP